MFGDPLSVSFVGERFQIENWAQHVFTLPKAKIAPFPDFIFFHIITMS
jgi:hypothetical protein